MTTCPQSSRRPPAGRWLLLRGWLFVALLLGSSACSTWAEIQGPRLGLSVDYDTKRGLSPRFELGYQYLRYAWAVGYGGQGGLAYAPLNQRVEIFADVNFYTAFFTPAVTNLGAVVAWTELGVRPGLRAGASVPLLWPPEACSDGFFSEPTGKCAGQRRPDDVVFPEWLPILAFNFTYLPILQENLLDVPGASDESFVFTFGGTFVMSEGWLVGGQRSQ